MPQFGNTSIRNLSEAHPLLRRLFAFVIQHWDCSIVDGARTVEEQEKNVARGVSKTMRSMHLPQPDPNDPKNNGLSWAVDAPLYPVDYAKVQRGLDAIRRADPTMSVLRFYRYAGFVEGVARHMGIALRWGGDWNGDTDVSDQTFIDLPHFELRSTKVAPPPASELGR